MRTYQYVLNTQSAITALGKAFDRACKFTQYPTLGDLAVELGFPGYTSSDLIVSDWYESTAGVLIIETPDIAPRPVIFGVCLNEDPEPLEIRMVNGFWEKVND